MRVTQPLLLHVGHIKTASTWLQRNVFDDARLGFRIPAPTTRGDLIAEFVVSNPYAFDPVRARRHFLPSPYLSDKQDSGLVSVLSDECLLGDPMQRRYDGHAVAQRLHAAFREEGKVLICIREQKSMALSMFREYIKQGNPHSIQMFVGTGRERRSMTPILRPDYLEYHHAISFYTGLFGRDNVCVLPYELLREQAQVFVNRLQNFVGISPLPLNPSQPVNVGASAVALAIRRPLNRFMVKNPLSTDRGSVERGLLRLTRMVDMFVPSFAKVPFEERLRSFVEDRYQGLFRESNAAVQEMTGLNLKELGWDV